MSAPVELGWKILGRQNANIKMLRKQTQTKIFTMESETTFTITIQSDSQEKVDKAKVQVEGYVESVRKDQPFTHFVAIPVVCDKLFVQGDGGMRGFLNRVQQFCQLSSRAWSNLNRLHFTLLTLHMEEEDCERVQKIIDDVVAHFEWQGDTEIEIAGINTFGKGKDGPRLYYAQPRGTQTYVEMKRLQEALAIAIRENGVRITEVVDKFHITLLRKSWVVQGMWAGTGMLELAAEYRPPPAPLDGVSLCRRYVWKPDEFWFTYGRAPLQVAEKQVTFQNE